MPRPHIPVLMDEILQGFAPVHLCQFIDCTLGAGGHAAAILAAHQEIEKFIGIDQDPLACRLAKETLQPWHTKVSILSGNFSHLNQLVASQNITQVDGILMDLGVSSMQLDQPEKGFSFMADGPLDMRMNPENSLTAAEVVNTFSEEKIGLILRDYGEEKQWRTAARAIVKARQARVFRTTKELVNLLYPVLMNKTKKTIHPLTLVFQGLRLFVNRELENLRLALPQALSCLKPQGRLAVISFHSLEDRIVKNFFNYEADDKENTTGLAGLFLDKPPRIRHVVRKPLVAIEKELLDNPRSRSAKLRIIEKR